MGKKSDKKSGKKKEIDESAPTAKADKGGKSAKSDKTKSEKTSKSDKSAKGGTKAEQEKSTAGRAKTADARSGKVEELIRATASEATAERTSTEPQPEVSGKARKKAAEHTEKLAAATAAIVDALRADPSVRLADIDTSSTPGFEGDKADAEILMAELAPEVAELQERLYAESRQGGNRSVLLVIQGLDTSGKGGIMRHVVGLLDPQGVKITAFKAPTAEERRHPFLWRIRKGLPAAGMIGVFDRSHYEDVLVPRVEALVPSSTWRRRYGQIRTFERTTSAGGTRIVKVMLHIGADEQKARLAERLDRPDKHWKYNPGDIDTRLKWEAYQEAYGEAVAKTTTDEAPWFVVPADHKWYARLAVQQILLDVLRDMDPQWPTADFDVEQEKRRLAES